MKVKLRCAVNTALTPLVGGGTGETEKENTESRSSRDLTLNWYEARERISDVNVVGGR
jgi:hypothetical protein